MIEYVHVKKYINMHKCEHVHTHAFGKDCKKAEEYTEEMVRRVHALYAYHVSKNENFNHTLETIDKYKTLLTSESIEFYTDFISDDT